VKVGRDALDEEAIRLIEENNPEVEFDWVRILKGPIQTDQRPNERRQEPEGGRPRRAALEAPQVAEPEQSDVDQFPQPLPAPAVSQSEELDEADVDAGLAPFDQTDVPEGGEQEAAKETEHEEALVAENPPTAAHRRLGSEGVSRLRARHAEIMARISERIVDPIRRDELKSAAERLNPDTWVTDEEVRNGLEQYEAVFESLRSTLGRRRKRRRRGGRGGQANAPSPGQLDGANSSEAQAGGHPVETPDDGADEIDPNGDESDGS